MKKVSPKRRAYLVRVNAKRNARRLVSKNKQARARGGLGHRRDGSRRSPASSTGLVRVIAPTHFNLDDTVSRRSLLRMLDVIRKHAIRGTGVLVDFRSTKKMYPGATLLFLAELDRLRQITDRRSTVHATYPRDHVVEQVLQQVGILGMVGLQPRMRPEEFPENVRHWRHATGEHAEGRKLKELMEQYAGRLAPSLTTGLYAGIVEAMTNCVHHAYPDELDVWRPDRVPDNLAKRCRNWWMFSQERDGNLTVAFCDLGIGIPVSVKNPKKWPAEALASILARLNVASPSAAHIKAATELHKTRTGKAFRGKGLPDILDVVRKARSGGLSIVSDNGVYKYNAKTGGETLYDFRRSIMGTLIQWTIPVPEAAS